MSTDQTTRDAQAQGAHEPVTRLPETPPGILRVTKTELVWPDKYNEDGTLREVPRVSLPLRVIERVNESRATRKAKKNRGPTPLDIRDQQEGDTFETGWRNKLIWGDNLLVMGSLLEQFAGKIDLIYIDPPFATGADFSFTAPIGDTSEKVCKERSLIEEKAYRDTWGGGTASYAAMLYSRLAAMRDLLSDTGSIYVHVDPRVEFLARGILDELFGSECFRNLIIWKRDVAGKGAKRISGQWPRNADTILWYSRSPDNWKFEQQYTDLKEDQKAPYRYADPNGRWYKAVQLGDYTEVSIARMEKEGLIHTSSTGQKYKKYYLDEARSTIDCIWTDILGFGTKTASSEILGFPTQKPEELVNRIVVASSEPGDLVADFFCGSGTTLAVAEKLGRRWIGCDLSRWAIHVTRKRLLGIENCKPFEVLNLGRYERRYWQGVTFGEGRDKTITEQALYEYLAFVLRLYGAQPVPGLGHLHGKKGRAMVHIGAVDAPVTIDEIALALEECVRVGPKELHVLGWEWEMGLAGPNNEYRKGGLMQEDARKKGVKLVLLQIPREMMEQQAVKKGDIEFSELAYLEVQIKQPKKLTAQVGLKDFVIPNTELIPQDVRSKVKKWSDYIDYWAVDWEFQNDTFMQGWVAYRTRRERRLPLVSDPHTYEKPGKYRILVKVIDIFGNDTSQGHTVDVR